MANLTDRLRPSASDPGRLPSGTSFRIGTHPFMAALGELERGQVTKAQVVAAFDMDATTEADLDAIISLVLGMSFQDRKNFRMELHDVLILSEAGIAYTTRAQLRTRLGL